MHVSAGTRSTQCAQISAGGKKAMLKRFYTVLQQRSEIAWHLLLHVNIWETIIESCGPRQCDMPSLFLASVTGYACLVRQEQVLEMLQDPNEEPPVKYDNERWGAASHSNKIQNQTLYRCSHHLTFYFQITENSPHSVFLLQELGYHLLFRIIFYFTYNFNK